MTTDMHTAVLGGNSNLHISALFAIEKTSKVRASHMKRMRATDFSRHNYFMKVT